MSETTVLRTLFVEIKGDSGVWHEVVSVDEVGTLTLRSPLGRLAWRAPSAILAEVVIPAGTAPTGRK